VRITHRKRAAETIAVFCGGCGLTAGPYWASHAFSNQYDDAYITYRYAIQLATGHGLAFNVGERIDSASSLFQTVVLALLYRLGWTDLEHAGACIGILAAGGTVAVVYRAALSMSKSRLLAAFASATTGIHGLISGWAVSGMETVPYSFFASLVVYRLFIEDRRDWGVVLALLAAFLTRMEGILLVLAWCVVLAPELRMNSGRTKKLLQLAVVGISVSAFATFKLVYYGSFVSGAVAFKSVWASYQPRPSELIAAWQSTAIGVVLLGLGGLAFLPSYKARVALSLYLVASAASLLMGPRSGWSRYSVHLLPVFAMLAPAVLVRLKGGLRAFGVAVAAFVTWQAYASMDDMRTFVGKVAGHQACRKQVGGWLAGHPGGVVLSSDIGAIAYVAHEVSFVDAVGLTSPDVLDAYLHGGDVNQVLASKRPTLVADTYYGRGSGGQYAALSALTNPMSRLRGVDKPPAPARGYFESERLFQCRSPDGLLFAVGRLARRVR
jgi:hypothetical protein